MVAPVASILPEYRRSVAGIALDGGRLFIARRKPGGSIGGKWEFPGGKPEDGESDADALRREYLEEFGAEISVGPLLARAEFSNGGRLFFLSGYRVFLSSFGFSMAEHTEWRWAEPAEIEELHSSGCFAGSDMRLLPALRKCALL